MERICERVFNHLLSADDPQNQNDYVAIPSFNRDNTTLPRWLAGSNIRIRVRFRRNHPGNQLVGPSTSFRAFGQEANHPMPQNVLDEHDLVEVRTETLNVDLTKICDGTNSIGLTINTIPRATQVSGGPGGANLSKKVAIGVTPRVGNHPFFRVYYESYMRKDLDS